MGGTAPELGPSHTASARARGGRSQRQRDIRAKPCSSPQEGSQNFRGLILGCHCRSLGIGDLGRNIPRFPCSVSSPSGKVPGSRGEDGIAAAFQFIFAASLPPRASKLWHLDWSWQVGHAGSS